MQFADKQRYQAWQSRMFRLDLPANLVQQKVLLFCVDPTHLRALRSADPSAAVARLPPATSVPMYHMGTDDSELVSVGHDPEKGLYKAAATDLGGLSNVRWKVGDRPQFTPVRRKATAREVYAEWKRLAGRKAFAGQGRFARVRKWLDTVPAGHVLGFARMPPVARHVITAQRARDLTGEYWVRMFGGDDARYARSAAPRSEVARLYLAVDPNGFVTPTINRFNLLNEYTWADTGKALNTKTLARIP